MQLAGQFSLLGGSFQAYLATPYNIFTKKYKNLSPQGETCWAVFMSRGEILGSLGETIKHFY